MTLALLAGGLALAACGGTKSPKASTTTSTAASHSTTTAPTKTTLATPPTTIPFSVSQVKTGTGPASLAQFTVPTSAKEWDIDWVFDCTKAPGGTGSFKISVVGHGAAADTTDAGVTESGRGTAGLVRNYDTGIFNLNVVSPCTWTVRVEITT